MERGGRASKLGHSYERLWAVRQALYVIQGTHLWLLWEPLGDAEPGVDLWVGGQDDRRIAHQAKRDNGSKAYWSVSDLKGEGVLAHAKLQLERDNRAAYLFVSACGVRELPDLAEMSHRSDDSESFYDSLVRPSRDRCTAFRDLMKAWDLDPARVDQRAKAYLLLQRMAFRIVARETSARAEVEFLASLLLDGEPSQAVTTLGDLLDKHLGRTLHADQLRALLAAKGIRFRALEGDATLPVALERLQRRFVDAISLELIDGVPLDRAAVQEILTLVGQDVPPRLILVHGEAGSGQSVVAQQAFSALRMRGTPCLPIQLHIRPPHGSPRQYGMTSLELPASPASSLRAIAASRRAVLILDQLDALRITSMNSHAAWEACATIIQDALADPNMVIILACRTFDLENDPKIASWKRSLGQHGQGTLTSVRVGDLSEAVVARLLKRRGVDFDTLPDKRRRLLRQPATLALWWTLSESGEQLGDFSNATELLRQFMRMRRRDAETDHGVSATAITAALSAVTDRMDESGLLTVHDSLLAEHLRTIDALCSVGLLRLEARTVRFAHQSYFDHLVAVHALSLATSGGRSVVEWARTNQSLFRREQLRQLMTLLRDADPAAHSAALRDLILGDGIRFHLKHLALGLVSQANPPTEYEAELVVALAEHADWWPHAIGPMISSSPAWFDALHQRGCFARWLSTWTQDDRVQALLMAFRSIIRERGSVIDQLMAPYWSAEAPWPVRLQFLASLDPSADTRGLAEYRLRRVASRDWGLHEYYLDGMAEGQSEYVIRLMHAATAAWVEAARNHIFAAPDRDPPAWRFTDRSPTPKVLEAVRRSPADAWRDFSGHLRSLAIIRRMRRMNRLDGFSARDWALQRGLGAAEAFVESVAAAAIEGLVAFHPSRLDAMLQPGESASSPCLQYPIAKGLLNAPAELADPIVLWLLRRPARFDMGDGHKELHWTPATDLIKRFSALCSDATFERLQSAILAYHGTSERRSFEWQREAFREGRLRRNDWGHAQNHLLNALASDRMSSNARHRASTWRAKFGDPSLDRPTRDLGGGGTVQSPIPPDRIPKLSDLRWLEIIAKPFPIRDRRKPLRRIGREMMGDASAEQFAGALAAAARANPKRFAKLALAIPASAHPVYVTELLRALAEDKHPGDIKAWEGASIEELEAIIAHVGACREREYVMSVCRVVGARPDTQWSDATIHRITSFADHPHPEVATEEARTGDPVAAEQDVDHIAINCVRGAVAGALTRIVWARPDSLNRILPTAELLVSDAHVAVRHEALSICLPLWNQDKDRAVRLMVRGCDHPDDRVLASFYVQRFIGYACWSHLPQIQRLIERMARSSIKKVAQNGAGWATVCHFQHNALTELFEIVRVGTTEQRLGVADVVADLYGVDGHPRSCDELVAELLEDDSDAVRRKAAMAFYRPEALTFALAPDLATSFVRSRAFVDDPRSLLNPLAEFGGDLRRFSQAVLLAAEILTGSFAERSRDLSQGMAFVGNELSGLLLRLYESAHRCDPLLQEACLDRWDSMLRNRVGMTENHLRQLDS